MQKINEMYIFNLHEILYFCIWFIFVLRSHLHVTKCINFHFSNSNTYFWYYVGDPWIVSKQTRQKVIDVFSLNLLKVRRGHNLRMLVRMIICMMTNYLISSSKNHLIEIEIQMHSNKTQTYSRYFSNSKIYF